MTHAEQQAAAHKARIGRMWDAAPKPLPKPQRKIIHIPIHCDDDIIDELRRELAAAKMPTAVVAQIKSEVCAAFRVSLIDLESSKRALNVVEARQSAIYLATTLTRHSALAIAKWFHRDHTTVLHARDKIAAQRLGDARLDKILRSLETKFEARGIGGST